MQWNLKTLLPDKLRVISLMYTYGETDGKITKVPCEALDKCLTNIAIGPAYKDYILFLVKITKCHSI